MSDRDNNPELESELDSLLKDLIVEPQQNTQDGQPLDLSSSGIPLDESQIKSFYFEDEVKIDLTQNTTTPNEGEFPEDILKNEEGVSTKFFTEEGLSEDLRRQMLFDETLKEGVERTIDSSEFADLISDVLTEQESMDTYSDFEANIDLTDTLKEQFELERQKELLDVNNNILSIQNEEEEITEFILCEGIYSDPFKIFIHTSPLVKEGEMPLVIELEGEYILFKRINPEPKVLRAMLKVLPNFKFTHVTPNGESPLTPFSCVDKCIFTS